MTKQEKKTLKFQIRERALEHAITLKRTGKFSKSVIELAKQIEKYLTSGK